MLRGQHDGGDVGDHDGVELVDRELAQGVLLVHALAVDEDGDGAHLLVGLLRGRLHGGLVGGVTDIVLEFLAGLLLQLGAGVAQLFLAAGGDGDLCAALGKGFRDQLAEAAGAAEDDRVLSAQIKEFQCIHVTFLLIIKFLFLLIGPKRYSIPWHPACQERTAPPRTARRGVEAVNIADSLNTD